MHIINDKYLPTYARTAAESVICKMTLGHIPTARQRSSKVSKRPCFCMHAYHIHIYIYIYRYIYVYICIHTYIYISLTCMYVWAPHIRGILPLVRRRLLHSAGARCRSTARHPPGKETRAWVRRRCGGENGKPKYPRSCRIAIKRVP